MGISLLGASTDISVSDLVTQPQWTLLGSFTSSVGVTTTTFSSIPQTYRKLRVYVNNLYFSALDNLRIRPNNNSSALYIQYGKIEASNLINRNSDNQSFWRFPQYGTNTQRIDAVIDIENYNSSTDNKFMKYDQYVFGGSSHFVENGHGFFTNTTPITSLTFYSGDNSGAFSNVSNITGVGIFLYGAK